MNQTIGYKWEAVSDDDCFHDKSERAFISQEDCYNDMMHHAVDKMKWNIEWDDMKEANDHADEDGVIRNSIALCYTLDCLTHKIVHKSYSGTYTYRILPIVVDDEEAARVKIVEEWITRKDGMDGGICNITGAYTICDDPEAWEKVMQEWDCAVPACPDEVPENLAEVALNMHLAIQKVADGINRKIESMTAKRYADTHILAQYLINGETRAYTYCLGDMNDCNHYFDDEESLVATFVLTDKGESEEDYYLQKPIAEVTALVNEAMACLEGRDA